MKPFPNASLEFQEAYAVGDQLWMLGKMLHDDPKYAKPSNWILTYRYAVRAMLARIATVDREYRGLNEPGYGTATAEEMASKSLATGGTWFGRVTRAYFSSRWTRL